MIPPKEKRVRFASSLMTCGNESKCCDDSQHVDVDLLWWSPTEIKFFKMDAQLLAEQAMHNESLNGSIQHAFECAGRIASATKDEQKLFQKLETMVYESCLSVWLSRHSSRGTERRVLKRSPCKRSRERNNKALLDHRSMVLSNQGKLNQEQLRKKCLQLSRQERVFARMLGIADSVTVQTEFSASCVVKDAEVPPFSVSSSMSLVGILSVNHKLKRFASNQA